MALTVMDKKRYTYKDYLETPEDERYELIEGDLLMAPAPIPNHQRISGRLDFALRLFVIEKELGEVFYAPCDVYLDAENVVQPDILFISKERLNIIGEKNIQGAPDLVIEIISESTAYRDLVQKKRLYARFGVKEYWIMIPGERSVEVYIIEDLAFALFKVFNAGDTLCSPFLKGFDINLEAIF